MGTSEGVPVFSRVFLSAVLISGCVCLSGVANSATQQEFCILDNAVTDKLGGDYEVKGSGKPSELVAGKGVRPTDDGLVRVYNVDSDGNEVQDGLAFFLYPEIFAFEPKGRSTALAGSAGTGGGYGSGGGGGKICD
ncbi:MAG: hypothetical protein DHS20C03_08180 [Minwuia thermotolerans]|nr:MAG: hypothetical protein DHS20C03_08180 [Minwuia thermotolerans]